MSSLCQRETRRLEFASISSVSIRWKKEENGIEELSEII